MDDDLLILGAGQYAAVVYEIAESMGCFDRIDFLDDNETEMSIGSFADCDKFASTYKNAIVAIGNVGYIDCNITVMPEATVPSKTRVNSNTVYFFRN